METNHQNDAVQVRVTEQQTDGITRETLEREFEITVPRRTNLQVEGVRRIALDVRETQELATLAAEFGRLIRATRPSVKRIELTF
jgi:hypothetical protein